MKRNNTPKPQKLSQEASLSIPQEAFDWYDEYAHGDIDRRTFLTRLASLSVAGLTVSAIGGALIPDYAKAEQVCVPHCNKEMENEKCTNRNNK